MIGCKLVIYVCERAEIILGLLPSIDSNSLRNQTVLSMRKIASAMQLIQLNEGNFELSIRYKNFEPL